MREEYNLMQINVQIDLALNRVHAILETGQTNAESSPDPRRI